MEKIFCWCLNASCLNTYFSIANIFADALSLILRHYRAPISRTNIDKKKDLILPAYWPSWRGSMVCIISWRRPCRNLAPVCWPEDEDTGWLQSDAVLDVTLPPGWVPTLVSLDMATVPCCNNRKVGLVRYSVAVQGDFMLMIVKYHL